LLQDVQFIKNELNVYVISSGDWSWALAWVQLGVEEVSCVALNQAARSGLDILSNHPTVGRFCKAASLPSRALLCQDSPPLLCGHLDDQAAVAEALRSTLFDAGAPWAYGIVTHCLGRASRRRQEALLGKRFDWNEVRHRRLGGLTSARLHVGWLGPRSDKPTAVPGQRRAPLRPLGLFLEPSVRLGMWRRVGNDGQSWRPLRADSSPCPWPLPPLPMWVEAPTCFLRLGGRRGEVTFIERPLTDKERCQLIDLREDWAGALLDLLWPSTGGHVVPLRILNETSLALLPWIRSAASSGTETDFLKDVELDFGRVCPPWVNAVEEPLSDFKGWNWAADSADDVRVAARADDAGVDLSLWAVGGDGPKMEGARDAIRSFMLAFWRRRLTREACAWLRSVDDEEELAADTLAVRDCIARCSNATWWEWSDGSRLLFWRWPMAWRREARDGAPGFHKGVPLPRRFFPAMPVTEEWMIQKDDEKLEKLIDRRYLESGLVLTVVPHFAVPKGNDDIRIVWDLAKNGLNEHMFTPSFVLPTMSTFLRRLHSGSYCGDVDIGEQFHNYVLHRSERLYCGVDIPERLVNKLKAKGIEVSRTMRWARLVFGWQSSPYLALRMLARALELVRRHPGDSTSAFAWDRVVLNLPGGDGYDPGRPRVSRLTEDGYPAADDVSFFDDVRVMAATDERCQAAVRQLASGIQFYGNQDASRKRDEVSQRAGAWAGGIAYTDKGVVRKFLSQKKWDRAKEFLRWVEDNLDAPEGLERVKFRSGKGFLLHVASTYELMAPYLKGFHLSEDAWRPGRDAAGWRESAAGEADDSSDTYDSDDGEVEGAADSQPILVEDAPIRVFPVPRLRDDVEVLLQMFADDLPVQVLVRPVSGACYVAYGAGDASGEGFGSSLHPLGMPPLLRQGFWCHEEAEHTSNWRELRNLLEAVRIEAMTGRLAGRELWLATDNSTAAYAFNKGSSTSRLLHEMVTEFKLLSLRGNFSMNIFHISGTRMIEIGVDALSRGDFHLGNLAGNPSSAAPLHLSSIQRSSKVEGWLSHWISEPHSIAQPRHWFYEAQQAGDHRGAFIQPKTWVWDLPPAAALHALEELGLARLKRHECLRGVVIIPLLMEHEWRRKFIKITDLQFDVPAGAFPFWPKEMHESLTIGLYLPLLRISPWSWKCVPFMASLGMALSRMFKAGDPDAGVVLRQFWSTCARAPFMQECVVSRVLHGTSWYKFLGLSPSRPEQRRIGDGS
jgi:hypothetical protein